MSIITKICEYVYNIIYTFIEEIFFSRRRLNQEMAEIIRDRQNDASSQTAVMSGNNLHVIGTHTSFSSGGVSGGAGGLSHINIGDMIFLENGKLAYVTTDGIVEAGKKEKELTLTDGEYFRESL